MRDPKYRKWLMGRQCVLLTVPNACFVGCCDQLTPRDPCHTVNNGMRSKGADSSCVPLCRKHHLEFDAGREAFQAKYGVDMQGLAHMYYADYLEENSLVPKSD
jgi:hypothetical protein